MFFDAKYGPFPYIYGLFNAETRTAEPLRKSNTMNPVRDLKCRTEPAPDPLRIIRRSFQTSKY